MKVIGRQKASTLENSHLKTSADWQMFEYNLQQITWTNTGDDTPPQQCVRGSASRIKRAPQQDLSTGLVPLVHTWSLFVDYVRGKDSISISGLFTRCRYKGLK